MRANSSKYIGIPFPTTIEQMFTHTCWYSRGLPASNGFSCLFTVTDGSTRWQEATPMEHETTLSCASVLVSSWVSRVGIPEHITSDRDGHFASGLWSSLVRLLGIQLHYITTYHPQANCMIERLHRTLKAALMARCTGTYGRSMLDGDPCYEY